MAECDAATELSIEEMHADAIRQRYSYFSSLTNNKHILDVRCGLGFGISALRECASVTGIDLSPEAIAYVRTHFSGKYCRADMMRLPFESDSFDVVLCLGLENVFLSGASEFLAGAWRVLRPGGSLVMTAPMLGQLKHSGNPEHFFEYTPEVFRLLVERYFSVSSIEQFAGLDGSELRFIGEKLATPAGETDNAIQKALGELGRGAFAAAELLAKPPVSIAAPANTPEWLEQLPWDYPLQAADALAPVLQSLICQAETGQDRSRAQQCHEILDWLDEHQDARTGLWGAGSLREALAAAGRFAPYYDYIHRPMRAVTKLADAALSLDHQGPRLEPAAAWRVLLLCAIRRKTQYRAHDIKVALARAFWNVWNECVAPAGGGSEDACAAVLRQSVLANIAALFPADLPAVRSDAVESPELGYCRCEHDPAGARLWMREPAGGSARFKRGAPVAAVVACYDLGLYLFEALDSIARQTAPELYAVIADDGSTDPFTIGYLEFLAERGYDVLRLPHGGVVPARTAAINRVESKYICTVDADDRVHPTWFERAQTLLDADPEIGFVSCHYRAFDNDTSEYRYNDTRFPEMLAQNEAVIVSVFRREAFFKAGGYNAALQGVEDWGLWIGILEAGYRATVIPEILFNYRIRPGSVYAHTRKPDTYMAKLQIIMADHPRAFEAHWRDVIRLRARLFAELVQAHLAEIEGSRRTKAYLEAQLANERDLSRQRYEWARAMEAGKLWLEEQLKSWERLGEKQNRDYEEVRAALASEQEKLRIREEEVEREKRLLEEQLEKANADALRWREEKESLGRRVVRRLNQFVGRTARAPR